MVTTRERNETQYDICKLADNRVEIGGLDIKCVSSNVRRAGIPWRDLQLIPGIGREGNLVVVEAMASDGFRTAIENQLGRDEHLYKGDRFVAVLANRHSGTSESGDIPVAGIDIGEDTRLHLLAAGAIAGIKSAIPARATKEPLPLKPLGLVAHDGKPLDLIELSGGHHEMLDQSAPIIMVCGTSAEVGKTTTSVGLIKAFSENGIQAAGTKFAGTGRMRDILSLRDAGASPWLDFPDVGLPTTYTSPERFTKGIYTLFNYVNLGRPHVIVAEAGGDPIEANIPTFLADPSLMQYVKALVVVAGDVMGMMGMVSYLRQFSQNTPIFLADPKDRNPYTTRERVKYALPGLPMFNSLNPAEVQEIVGQILQT